MRILGLTVQNVRGLTDLQLNLDGKNLVIWGPNGAGKSCVVDAIDFLFTGNIDLDCWAKALLESLWHATAITSTMTRNRLS